MRTMTCLIGAEHDIAVHLCNFIKDSRGSSRVLPYHAQKKGPSPLAPTLVVFGSTQGFLEGIVHDSLELIEIGVFLRRLHSAEGSANKEPLLHCLGPKHRFAEAF